MKLSVDKQELYVFPPINDLLKTEISFNKTIRGRTVRLSQNTIVHPDTYPFIILCEVQVWGK